MKTVRFLFMALMMAFPAFLYAQVLPRTVDNTMRSSGRIYVVITVLVIILSGIFFYLFRLERKIRALEKER